MSEHATHSSFISYIMFTTLPGSEPDWVLEVYVRACTRVSIPPANNVYIINRSGNIDSISPSSGIQHTYAITERVAGVPDSYRIFCFNGQEYYGDSWSHINISDLDQLVFSNLTDQENSMVVREIKSVITEVLL